MKKRRRQNRRRRQSLFETFLSLALIAVLIFASVGTYAEDENKNFSHEEQVTENGSETIDYETSDTEESDTIVAQTEDNTFGEADESKDKVMGQESTDDPHPTDPVPDEGSGNGGVVTESVSDPVQAELSGDLEPDEETSVKVTDEAAEDNEAFPEETSEDTGSSSEKSSGAVILPEESPKEESGILLPETADMDFSSRRLIVKSDDPSVFQASDPVIGSHEDIYLIQYMTEQEAAYGYSRLKPLVTLIETDTGLSTADGEVSDEETDPGAEETADDQIPENEETDFIDPASVSGETASSSVGDMTDQANPVDRLDEESRGNQEDRNTIALIDTGAEGPNVTESISLIGDSPSDDNGHGTRMMEAIAAQNKNARILSIKALGADGRGDVSAVYSAVKLAIEKKVGIISLSISALRKTDSILIDEVIAEAIDCGITVIGAAGNNGSDAASYIPGGIDSVIVAGACDDDGTRLRDSNYGPTVDINVVASSTSEAAAKLAGFVSAKGVSLIGYVAGLLYPTDYDPAKAEAYSEEVTEKYQEEPAEENGADLREESKETAEESEEESDEGSEQPKTEASDDQGIPGVESEGVEEKAGKFNEDDTTILEDEEQNSGLADTEITCQEVRYETIDAGIEAYISSHLMTEYSVLDRMDLVNYIAVQETLLDLAYVYDGITIEKLMVDDTALQGILGSPKSYMPVYDLSDSSAYYVAFINPAQTDEGVSVLDVEFAKNNTNGEVVDGIIYDASTGIAYIPKTLYKNDSGQEVLLALQGQLLESVADGLDYKSTILVTKNISGAISSETVSIDAFTYSVGIYIGSGLMIQKVVVNGVTSEATGYTYDQEDGIIYLSTSSAAISTLEITARGEVNETIFEVAESTTLWDYTGSGYTLTIPSNINVGDILTGFARCVIANGNAGSQAEVRAGVADYTHAYLASSNNFSCQSMVSAIRDGGSYDLSVYTQTGSGYYNANITFRNTDLFSTTDGKSMVFSELPTVSINCIHAAAMMTKPVMNQSFTTNTEIGTYYTYVRILELDRAAGYVVIGILVPRATAAAPDLQSLSGVYKFYGEPETGLIQAKKTSGDSSVTSSGGFDLSGITFNVYTDSGCTTQAKDTSGNDLVLTSGADGVTGSASVQQGTYWVRENSSSLSGKGWLYNSTPVQVTVGPDNTTSPAVAAITNMPDYGYLKALKSSNNVSSTENSCYSLEGIKFKVYKDQNCTTEALDAEGNAILLISGSSGYTEEVRLKSGTYYVRELEESLTGKGWYYNANPTKVTVSSSMSTADTAAVAEVKNNPRMDPIGVLLKKLDKKTGEDVRRVG